MSNFFSVLKDFIISALIALLTANLLNLSNLIYQIIISILLLIIIFLLLRRFDKLAKRIEILSIIYCENFVRPLLDSFLIDDNRNIDGTEIKKFKLMIIIPKSPEEIATIVNKLRMMKRFTLVKDGSESRSFSVFGRFIEEDFLLIFDTPSLWLSGLNFLTLEKKLKKKDVSRLSEKLNDDIRSYTKKYILTKENENHLKFIFLDEFQGFYE